MIGRITKVKLDRQTTEIHWESDVDRSRKETVLRSEDEPRHEMFDAFGEIVPRVISLLEAPMNLWAGQMRVTGISYSMASDSTEGAVVTCQVKLNGADAPLIINTPHLTFEAMGKLFAEAVEKVRTEAQMFVDGKRAQAELAGVSA